MIKIKRAYEGQSTSDGKRFLVDRLWPRGVSKEKLAGTTWLKDVAPSDELRHWYHHDLSKWDEFRKRYSVELEANPESWRPLVEEAKKGTVTLLYSAKHIDCNNAAALKEYLEEKLGKTASQR